VCRVHATVSQQLWLEVFGAPLRYSMCTNAHSDCAHVSIFKCLDLRVRACEYIFMLARASPCVYRRARVNVQLRMEILHPEPRCLIICMRHSRLHMYAPFLSAASLMAACTLAAHRNGGVQMSAAIIFHVV